MKQNTEQLKKDIENILEVFYEHTVTKQGSGKEVVAKLVDYITKTTPSYDEIKREAFTIDDFNLALPIADKMMKDDNGHEYQVSLKTRCIHCGKSPNNKRKCGAWFQTFVSRLRFALLNKETYLVKQVLDNMPTSSYTGLSN